MYGQVSTSLLHFLTISIRHRPIASRKTLESSGLFSLSPALFHKESKHRFDLARHVDSQKQHRAAQWLTL
jgi:hypothetical protein